MIRLHGKTDLKLKAIAILLSFNLLLAQTPLQEILKLPLLFSHFEEHHEKNSELNIGDFLKMHYSADAAQDSDQDKDMQLPFKKVDSHLLGSIFACFTEKPAIQHPVNIRNSSILPREDARRLHPQLDGIFQPPRVS